MTDPEPKPETEIRQITELVNEIVELTGLAGTQPDDQLLSVHRDDLLEAWVWASVAVQAELADPQVFMDETYLNDIAEVLDRVARALGNPCSVCHMTNGVHKMDCYGGTR